MTTYVRHHNDYMVTRSKIEWHGLYADSWGDDLVPEAFAHPAKYARGLIRQIYAHLLERGMVKAGDVVGDPFGGIAAGALDAMLLGLHWRGVELEPRFVDLGGQNIALWNGRYAPHFQRWGTAVLVQGDSRQFAAIVGGLGVAISSPPYAGIIDSGDGPGARWDVKTHPGNPAKISSATSYGSTPGQLGAMPPGDLDAVVGSPPFENKLAAEDINFYRKKREQTGRNPNSAHASGIDSYGFTPGNIGNDSGDTFWQASRSIVQQVHLALKPGGYAAWVTGDFVRKGQRVHFGEQWLALCQACGFEPHTWVTAWKTEHHGTQLGIFEDVERRTDRVSFFRRLANERNPDAAILNEDVIIVRKVNYQ